MKGDIEDVFADLLGRAGAEVIRYCPLTVRESLHDCLDKISLAGAIGPVDQPIFATCHLQRERMEKLEGVSRLHVGESE